ncbi:hypothetical protein [Butyrivibrio sp. VCB2006]|uniref:hypothetical protein n=1 Tax=Butyrivibrio sp. VCB2006 TaxID=1280679 RepID=UPI000492A6F8|nr:hypothetical protein [Butyrivibrio sp. VCB2006]
MTTITTNKTLPKITLEQAKRDIEQMTLIENFMFDSSIEDNDDAQIIIGKILKSIYGKEFKNIRIECQKQLNGLNSNYHGIRMDARITQDELEDYLDASIVDIEMENRPKDKKELPRRHRYYGALEDSKRLETNTAYNELPNYVSITISSYDPFDVGDMCYVAASALVSHPAISYDDGVKHLYFYCKGRPNFDEVVSEGLFKSDSHSKNLQEMLEYIVSGKKPEVSNPDIDAVDNVVTKIKHKKEVTTKYMRWVDEKHYIIRDAKFEAGLSTIRFDRQMKRPKDETRKRLIAMGIKDDDIDDLFAEIDAEEKEPIVAD